MSETMQILTVILGFASTALTAILGFLVATVKAKQTATDGRVADVARVQAAEVLKTSATDRKVEEVGRTADTIHTLTNSGMSEVRAELAAARLEIKALQQSRVEQAFTLAAGVVSGAQAQAQAPLPIPTAGAIVPLSTEGLPVVPAPAVVVTPAETLVPDLRHPGGPSLPPAATLVPDARGPRPRAPEKRQP